VDASSVSQPCCLCRYRCSKASEMASGAVVLSVLHHSPRRIPPAGAAAISLKA
jgi:hypothetical protein